MPAHDYIDPTVDTTGLTKERLQELHGLRLRGIEALARAAGNAKRRLGPDATPAQLAADKKLCRSLAHRFMQLRGMWLQDDWSKALRMVSMADPSVAVGDAGVVWERFARDELERVNRSLREVATWGVKAGPQGWIWAKQRVVLLERERDLWREIAGVES